jgi:hypothetical protein
VANDSVTGAQATWCLRLINVAMTQRQECAHEHDTLPLLCPCFVLNTMNGC